jgi:CRISPR/Cas system-associated exonuclease Cas4 (RecB family)
MQNENGRFKFWDFENKKYIYSDLVLQMSVTDIKSSEECEWKLYHRMEGKFKPKKNIYLIIGSCFHSVVEQDMRYKAGRGVNKSWKDLEAFFEDEWKKSTKNITDFGKYTPEQSKQKCKNYIYIYSLKASPLIYPLNNESIEKFFRVYINYEGKRLGITGKCDIIDKSLTMIDHKTSSSQWLQSEADKEIQAQVYPYLMKISGLEVKKFQFNVVCGNDVKVYPVEYDTKKVKEILIQAFDIKRHIEEGNILRVKNPSVCKWCDFRSVCQKNLLNENDDL